MPAAFDVEVTLARPAAAAGAEPEEPVRACIRVKPQNGGPARPRLDLSFVLDASASMHRFVLDPQQREQWRQRAEQRGEISRQSTDGRTGMVWTGQTLRELQQVVSTPMLSSLRGVWRTLESLELSDQISVTAFADQAAPIYQDTGAGSRDERLATAKVALGRLGSGVDESGLGRGTRLAAALHGALSRSAQVPGQDAAEVVRRIILVSDGIIEDAEACRPLLDRAVDHGVVISVIGVGDEFDEEFLMGIADLTRGNYYYAPTAPEVEQAMAAEREVVAGTVARKARLSIVPEAGSIFHDVYPVAPTFSEFRATWVEDGAWSFHLGDLSTNQKTELLLELAPAAHGEGQVRIGSVRVEGHTPESGESFTAEAPVQLYYTSDPMLLQARDEEVLETAQRLEIYREERRAAEALSRGDRDSATRHLQSATRMLRQVGAAELADEMDAAADDAAAGTRDLSRTKRVKAGTRRLNRG